MTETEARNIIINNQMTYRDFANYFNISTDDAIRVFQRLDLKRCSKGKDCINFDGSVQTRSNFRNDKTKQDGLNTQCTYCIKQKEQQRYQKNKEQYKQRSYQYRQDNKEYCRRMYQQYHQNNKEHRNQLCRQYHQNNRGYKSQKVKEYNFAFTRFNTYSSQISYAEETRQDPDNLRLLQVKCTYCNSWFNPINLQIRNRINAFKGTHSLGAENRFYCSNECKYSCPIYHQKEYSKDDPRYINNLSTSREVQTELRQLVFERDNWTCQKCSTHKDNLAAGISLHCHHKEGVRHDPLESADTDMCITVCSECHKEIHKIPGCKYQDFRCKSEEKDDLSSRN